MLTFSPLLLSPVHKSAQAVIYSVSSLHMTVLLFSSYARVEAFSNFVTRVIVCILIIRSSALHYYLPITFTLSQYPLHFRVLSRWIRKGGHHSSPRAQRD